MILETIRVWADGLKHEAAGVNAQLSQVGVDAGDRRPPLVKKILDETRDAQLALDVPPDDWPVVQVSVDTPATTDGEVGTIYRDGEVTVTARYITGEQDPHQANRDALYTLRAMVRSTRQLLLNERLADRQRNNVTVRAARDMMWGALEMSEGSRVAGAVVVRFQVRDGNP